MARIEHVQRGKRNRVSKKRKGIRFQKRGRGNRLTGKGVKTSVLDFAWGGGGGPRVGKETNTGGVGGVCGLCQTRDRRGVRRCRPGMIGPESQEKGVVVQRERASTVAMRTFSENDAGPTRRKNLGGGRGNGKKNHHGDRPGLALWGWEMERGRKRPENTVNNEVRKEKICR